MADPFHSTRLTITYKDVDTDNKNELTKHSDWFDEIWRDQETAQLTEEFLALMTADATLKEIPKNQLTYISNLIRELGETNQ
ncbi:hypothetical protein [Nitrosomonas marina]|uniref:Uncharacterized protein n=1 Tax=Nitrosomonas marina TaxID=917 RepID=A0A1H8G3M7_9PROT|nr:hypothetical protein [Nitrosomonas marina]SEN38380.1 hypothetical protein SAMN05216325_1168 [Nitrosomonas marina]